MATELLEKTEEEKKTEEKVTLPEKTEAEKIRELELDKARLEGQLSVRSEVVTPEPTPAAVDPEEERYQRDKQVVLKDASTMEEDDFKERYKMTPSDAKIHYETFERQEAQKKSTEENALIRAELRIAKKYGDKYEKHEKEIAKAIRDAGPDVRQNHERLAVYMERTLKGLVADEPAPKPAPKKEEPEVDKRMVGTGFEKPEVIPDAGTKSKGNSGKDEIPEADRKIAAKFGINSASELKKYKDSPYIETHLGGGVVFKDAEKGFEKVVSGKA